MRLDKYLSDSGLGSRREVKQLIKKKLVLVNGVVITSDKHQVAETSDLIEVAGERVVYQQYFYYMLNKPGGVITATKDSQQATVMELLKAADWRKDLFPVGRLDKDTEGLLLITNDGNLAHELLAPKKHVEKEYFAKVAGVMTAADIQQFATGIDLKEGRMLPASLSILAVDEASAVSEISLIIHEGKFHQVKRMVQSVGKEVTYLKRLRMGSLFLDDNLRLGEYRALTATELQQLKL